MKSCCENKSSELESLRANQKYVLIWVLIINLVMFFIEFFYGWLSNSTSLLADSLDMLGDAIVYAFSLFVLHRSLKWKGGAALLKGVIITVFGLFVLGEAIYKLTTDVVPLASMMGAVGFLALLSNGVCLYLLTKYKDDDVNMRSTWVCSRNDIIANVGVLLAALLVSIFESRYPDVIIGLIIAIIFLRSAFSVLKDAIAALRGNENGKSV